MLRHYDHVDSSAEAMILIVRWWVYTTSKVVENRPRIKVLVGADDGKRRNLPPFSVALPLHGQLTSILGHKDWYSPLYHRVSKLTTIRWVRPSGGQICTIIQ